MPFDESIIRFATAADARHIPKIRVTASKATCRSISPASVLEAFSVEKREAFWKELLSARRADSITLVARGAAREVIAFAPAGADQAPCLAMASFTRSTCSRPDNAEASELYWCEDSLARHNRRQNDRTLANCSLRPHMAGRISGGFQASRVEP
jgi:hypothetical protein